MWSRERERETKMRWRAKMIERRAHPANEPNELLPTLTAQSSYWIQHDPFDPLPLPPPTIIPERAHPYYLSIYIKDEDVARYYLRRSTPRERFHIGIPDALSFKPFPPPFHNKIPRTCLFFFFFYSQHPYIGYSIHVMIIPMARSM